MLENTKNLVRKCLTNCFYCSKDYHTQDEIPGETMEWRHMAETAEVEDATVFGQASSFQATTVGGLGRMKGQAQACLAFGRVRRPHGDQSGLK